MSTLEYIKIAFVFVGAVIILVAIARSIITMMRRISLREKARSIIQGLGPIYKPGSASVEHLREGEVVVDYNRKEVLEFLSQVTVEDMCSDAYLRRAVDLMTTGRSSDSGMETTEPEPVPA
jgi:hypothetical protein